MDTVICMQNCQTRLMVWVPCRRVVKVIPSESGSNGFNTTINPVIEELQKLKPNLKVECMNCWLWRETWVKLEVFRVDFVKLAKLRRSWLVVGP